MKRSDQDKERKNTDRGQQQAGPHWQWAAVAWRPGWKVTVGARWWWRDGWSLGQGMPWSTCWGFVSYPEEQQEATRGDEQIRCALNCWPVSTATRSCWQWVEKRIDKRERMQGHQLRSHWSLGWGSDSGVEITSRKIGEMFGYDKTSYDSRWDKAGQVW